MSSNDDERGEEGRGDDILYPAASGPGAADVQGACEPSALCRQSLARQETFITRLLCSSPFLRVCVSILERALRTYLLRVVGAKCGIYVNPGTALRVFMYFILNVVLLDGPVSLTGAPQSPTPTHHIRNPQKIHRSDSYPMYPKQLHCPLETPMKPAFDISLHRYRRTCTTSRV